MTFGSEEMLLDIYLKDFLLLISGEFGFLTAKIAEFLLNLNLVELFRFAFFDTLI
jgi:hypothetical protein